MINNEMHFVAYLYIMETNVVLVVTVLPSYSSGTSACKNFGKEAMIMVN
jgi:hypothetical protein